MKHWWSSQRCVQEAVASRRWSAPSSLIYGHQISVNCWNIVLKRFIRGVWYFSWLDIGERSTQKYSDIYVSFFHLRKVIRCRTVCLLAIAFLSWTFYAFLDEFRKSLLPSLADQQVSIHATLLYSEGALPMNRQCENTNVYIEATGSRSEYWDKLSLLIFSDR